MTEATATDGGNTTSTDATATAGATSQPASTATAAPAAPAQPAVTNQPPTDGKAVADAAKPAEGNVDPKAVESAKAPETYEFKAPEGNAYSEAIIGAFVPVAKELNLTNEGAQKILDAIAPAVAQRQAEALDQLAAGFVTQSKADKEIGGDKFGENLAIALKAQTAFGTPALRELLDKSKLGDHPEVIRAFYRVGKAISEDTFVAGGLRPTAGDKISAADKLYGSSSK